MIPEKLLQQFSSVNGGTIFLYSVEICISAFTTKEVKDVKCRVSKYYQFRFIDEAAGTLSHANILGGPRPTPGFLIALFPCCRNGCFHKCCVYGCHKEKRLVCSAFSSFCYLLFALFFFIIIFLNYFLK